MPKTYEPIATANGTGSNATITFSSIAATYTDLILVIGGGSTNASVVSRLQFNSDTGSNYSQTSIFGNGTSALTNQQTNIAFAGSCISSNISTTTIYNIINYANTTTNKTVIGRGNATDTIVDSRVSMWRNTAAINRIDVFFSGGNFSSSTVVTLYGIKAA
jgi:hypothetical protein